jgi:hypothetical protein
MASKIEITMTVDHLPDGNLWKELVGDNKPITPVEFLERLFSSRPGEKLYIPYRSLLYSKDNHEG